MKTVRDTAQVAFGAMVGQNQRPPQPEVQMTIHLRRSVPFVLVLAAAACGAPPTTQAPAPQAPAPPPPITQAVVEQAVQELTSALVAGDAAKVGTGYKADAVLVSARGKVDTSAGIEAFWAGALKGGAGKNLKLAVEKWGASGDLAYSLSRFTGGITASSGYVLAVSERQADGSLKTVAQVSIPDPPAR
jgi:ketosteroid isomerase-like protein